jgi:hypothetical protein
MLTIAQVEDHFQRNIFPSIGRQYEFRSYPDQYAGICQKDGRDAPEWVKQDSPWRNHFEIAEYNRHNGCINNFWSPTISDGEITGWQKRLGKGHTLAIWC